MSKLGFALAALLGRGGETGLPVRGTADAFSWQPALLAARAYLEHAGVATEEAERLSRSIVVSCARDSQPATSEEAAALALEEAKTLALGLGRGVGRPAALRVAA